MFSIRYVIYGENTNRISEIFLDPSRKVGVLENEGCRLFVSETSVDYLLATDTVHILETEYIYQT